MCIYCPYFMIKVFLVMEISTLSITDNGPEKINALFKSMLIQIGKSTDTFFLLYKNNMPKVSHYKTVYFLFTNIQKQ